MELFFGPVYGYSKMVYGTILLTIYFRGARSARKFLVYGSVWYFFSSGVWYFLSTIHRQKFLVYGGCMVKKNTEYSLVSVFFFAILILS